VRPARTALAAVLRAAPSLAPTVERTAWRVFYDLANPRGRGAGTSLMNYGYAAPDAPPPDSPDRFGLQMYERVAGAADLTGRDVLEIGCGRGGGAAFVLERLGPRSVTGLDLSPRAIARCRAEHARPGLTFVAGDAERLPFPDAAFDAVLNVESSHCYPSVPRFLAEVARVLRPGGVLLLADFRHTVLPEDAEDALVPQEDVACLRRQLSAAGFTTLEEEDMTANVLTALRLDTPNRRARLERLPRPLRRHALAFAAVEGGAMYRAYAEGRWTYLRFALRRA
jgi:SAM-dependent methyltransferase